MKACLQPQQMFCSRENQLASRQSEDVLNEFSLLSGVLAVGLKCSHNCAKQADTCEQPESQVLAQYSEYLPALHLVNSSCLQQLTVHEDVSTH